MNHAHPRPRPHPPATPGRVRLVADERNNYDPTIHRTELLTGEPVDVGSRFRCTSIRGRRSVDMIVEIAGHDCPHRLRTTTHLFLMDIDDDLRFESEGEDILLRWASDLQPHGLLRLLTPLMAAVGRRQTRAIWNHLQTTLDDLNEFAPDLRHRPGDHAEYVDAAWGQTKPDRHPPAVASAT
jgi:hypothetical protein